MKKYLTGMRRQAERNGDKETNENLPKAKTRKYDEAYVALGFTVTTVGDEERPVCLLCLKMLAADSMKPNKLRRHLNTLHPNHSDKPLEFFQRKRAEYCRQSSRFVTATSVLLFSYTLIRIQCYAEVYL
ncbi:hypothetical protein NL108_002459 [Boleophthalmus pectinirostris]|nr:hypothetical protein NL108_002459 [Boleophthalmus pectinirostris]